MAFETTKDVLDHAREFHRQLGEFYSGLSSKSAKQRVKMLLDFMSDHEKHLEDTMARYEEEVSQKILNTWFQYSPSKEILTACKEINLEGKENLTVDDVIEIAVKLTQCLIDLYKEMAKNSECEDVRAVFNNLMEMERHFELQLVRDAQELKDL
jgi:rubrerythrin